jgi:hypothetical protein
VLLTRNTAWIGAIGEVGSSADAGFCNVSLTWAASVQNAAVRKLIANACAKERCALAAVEDEDAGAEAVDEDSGRVEPDGSTEQILRTRDAGETAAVLRSDGASGCACSFLPSSTRRGVLVPYVVMLAVGLFWRRRTSTT